MIATRFVPAFTSPLSRGAVVAAIFLAIALVETWPLAIHLDDRIAHDPGDPLFVAYVLNWNARVLPLSAAWWHPPFFWPAPDAITLSEPFLGLAPVSWLLTRMGANAAAVYNVLFIAAFWLAPLAAYFLAYGLTRDVAASFIAGLAFGYSPYRAAQLSHLQLLIVPALPLILLALHRAAGAGGFRWVAMAAALWLWQGTTSLYLLLFIPLAVALWLVWFMAFKPRVILQTLAAFSAAAVLALPLIAGYRSSHAAGDYSRGMPEVISLSADISDVAYASPDLALSATKEAATGPEHNLFPGFAILALAIVALTRIPFAHQPFRPITLAFLAVFVVASMAASIAIVRPFQGSVAGVDLSLTSPQKSLAIVWIAILGAALTSRTVGSAWRAQSITLGYALIALALWILSLGPEPTMVGNRIWYRPPYWVLYTHVAGFDGVRVPARLWTIVTLCLAVLAGLGAQRVLRGRLRPIVTVLIAGVILLEGSIALHFDPLPQPIDVPPEAEVVFELPAGNPFDDSAAMFRSLSHGRPVVNGYSGYDPPEYRRLVQRVAKGDTAAIDDAAAGRTMAIVLNEPIDASSALYRAIAERAESCRRDARVTICVRRVPRR